MKSIFFVLFVVLANLVSAQVLISDTTAGIPHSSAVLELQSTQKGLLFPRLTTLQRDSIIQPAAGLHIYNVDTGCDNVFDGQTWKSICVQIGDFWYVSDSSGFQRVRLHVEGDTTTQFTNFRIDLFPRTATDQAAVRFFRSTQTTGPKFVAFMRGNGTTQTSALIGVDGRDSFFQQHGGNLGIGTNQPQRTLHVNDVMRLEPRSGPPAGPSAGDLYFDSGLAKLRVFDGSAWRNLH
jgi:hypothetical protein